MDRLALSVLLRRKPEMLGVAGRTSSLPQEKLQLDKLATQRVRTARRPKTQGNVARQTASYAWWCGETANRVLLCSARVVTKLFPWIQRTRYRQRGKNAYQGDVRHKHDDGLPCVLISLQSTGRTQP